MSQRRIIIYMENPQTKHYIEGKLSTGNCAGVWVKLSTADTMDRAVRDARVFDHNLQGYDEIRILRKTVLVEIFYQSNE